MLRGYTGTALLELENEQRKAGMSKVRFTQDSRHGDWTKGQRAELVKTLALPPANQFKLYIVELEDGTQVWATDRDIEADNQLSFFDLLPG